MGSYSTHDERVRAVLGGQLAPAAPGGGHKIAYRCPSCGHIWYMAGAQSFPRLTDEQLAALLDELHADAGNLPYATCGICQLQSIGEVNLDQYGAGAGFGVSWEGIDPPGVHLLGAVIRLDWLQRTREPGADVVTDFAACRRFLGWLTHLPAPLSGYHPIDAGDSADMARTNRPGHGAPGTDGWRWQGAIWQASVPALGGRCYISLAQAMPPDEVFSLSAMFTTWRRLAEIIQAGRIAGEGMDTEA